MNMLIYDKQKHSHTGSEVNLAEEEQSRAGWGNFSSETV